jgi:DNA-binding NarL/FixJ family response regulator
MKILLVDDHVLFREGLSLLLRSLMQDVQLFEAGTVQDALSQIAAHGGMNLILLDLGLPDMVGTEAIGYVRDQYPDIPVVALSSSEDRSTVLSALDRGAMGFVPKSASSSILTGALQLILAHGIYLPPSVFLSDRGIGTESVADKSVRNPRPPTDRKTATQLGLTTRQADVLYRILQGKSAKLISRELNLSASTVKTHTSAVLRALNVTTRTQAVVAAGRIGLQF